MIHQLYDKAVESLHADNFYDAFICMFQRAKEIQQLEVSPPQVDKNELQLILEETYQVEKLLQEYINRYENALADLTRNTVAHLAYAKTVPISSISE